MYVEKKKNMSGLMEVLQARLKLSVGYPQKLYHINGIRVCRTSELQMYDEYVVVTNLDTRFRCAEYGRPRSPLVVIGPYSRHVCAGRLDEFYCCIGLRRLSEGQGQYLNKPCFFV